MSSECSGISPFPGLTVPFGSPSVPFAPVPLTYLDYSPATFGPALSRVAVPFVETLLGFFKAGLRHVTSQQIVGLTECSIIFAAYFFMRKYEGKVTLL